MLFYQPHWDQSIHAIDLPTIEEKHHGGQKHPETFCPNSMFQYESLAPLHHQSPLHQRNQLNNQVTK